jgi:hypothetical protein
MKCKQNVNPAASCEKLGVEMTKLSFSFHHVAKPAGIRIAKGRVGCADDPRSGAAAAAAVATMSDEFMLLIECGYCEDGGSRACQGLATVPMVVVPQCRAINSQVKMSTGSKPGL